ncbi:hypothetical protein [Streptomyces sp. BA2]|uniref:hypothetical protein n=1 Tax=Streptomyces sp. BA2 TaxID=436595 RepID=UPI001327C420|nr:hypothetical protein [Streptomyces sp. BA2]MWA16003.1 hypothetical protein [Streptomyces sp. BA2]
MGFPGAAAKIRADAAAAQLADDVPAPPVVSVVLPAPRPAAAVSAPEPADVEGDPELILEALTREQVLECRNRAAADHQVVHEHIERHGEGSAQPKFASLGQ